MHSRDVVVGAGLGALLVFLLDPAAGRRRRALVRDKAAWAARRTRDGFDAVARDMVNRSKGIAAATRGRLTEKEINDARLVERVRARLGRVCSHPRAVDVEAHDGQVTLRGPILSGEVDRVLATVAAVRGVRGVTNALEPHDSADGVPSLQGEGQVVGPNLDIRQRSWAPATKALVAAGIAATGACIAACARR